MNAQLLKLFTLLAVFCLNGPVLANCVNPQATLAGYNLTADGLIAFGADGFPDEKTYLAALQNPQDPILAKALAATKALIYSGQNELLNIIRYKEFHVSGPLDATLDQLVNRKAGYGERYKGNWWFRSSPNPDGGFGPGRYFQDTAPHFPKEIRFEHANGGALVRLGPGSKSTVYWPQDLQRNPNPVGPRFRENTDRNDYTGDTEMMAVIGATPDNKPEWGGFAFRKYGWVWVPQVKELINFEQLAREKGLAYAKSYNCIGCHYTLDANGKKVLHPLPFVLQTPEDFYQRGYRHVHAVEALVRQRGN